MPRHRKECIPKHRAQPPDENSGRRVPLNAAVEAARTGLGSARETGRGETQVDPAHAETVQFDAVRPEGMRPDGMRSDADGALADGSLADGPPSDGSLADGLLADGSLSDADVPVSASSHRRRSRPPRSRLEGSRPGGSRLEGSRPEGSRPAKARRAPGGGAGGNQQRRMRGLLVTPWFAAGAGFVIAAALALNSPHTVLTYRPNTSKCSTCIAPGAPANAKPGEVFKPPKPVRTAKASRKAGAARHGVVIAAGVAVGFQVVWNRNGEFAAIVTVPAQHASRGWRLRFEIPGRRIVQVFGAKWQPGPGGYGGMASTFSFQRDLPGHSGPPTPPGEGLPKRPGEPGDFGHFDPQQLKFLVTAQGAPVTPELCVLNGVRCHFG
jgi:hypothetical protein